MSLGTNLLRLAVAAALCAGSSAQAQLFRAYLISTGNDANPCTLPAPCRLLPAALNAVASGGEIWMLDSANYNTGTVTIGKSVSILAVPGAVGSIVALNGGPAISITAPNLKVALRNVVIAPVAGATAGTHGVQMTGASSLIIENSLFANLPGRGVSIVGNGTLKMSDTILRDNHGPAIYLQNGALATISTSQLIGNFGGVNAYGTTATTTIASISDSVISGWGEGASASTTIAGATVRVSVSRSTIEHTPFALQSTTSGVGAAEVNVGSSLIVENGYAWYQNGNGSSVVSLGNNHFSGNTLSLGSKSSMAPQ